MNVTISVSLLIATVVIAIIPAFGILYLFRSFLPEDPQNFLEVIFYIVQTVLVLFTGFFAVFFYADIAFPVVMMIFGYILGYDKKNKAIATPVEKITEKVVGQQEKKADTPKKKVGEQQEKKADTPKKKVREQQEKNKAE